LFFLTNPQFFYWDTAGLSNYRYPDPGSESVPPGQPVPGVQFAFAWELRNFLITGDDRLLPDFLQGATHTEVLQLARLDPFIPLPPPPPKPGDEPDNVLRPEPGVEAKDCFLLDSQSSAWARCVRDTLKDNELDKERFKQIGPDLCFPLQLEHEAA